MLHRFAYTQSISRSVKRGEYSDGPKKINIFKAIRQKDLLPKGSIEPNPLINFNSMGRARLSPMVK